MISIQEISDKIKASNLEQNNTYSDSTNFTLAEITTPLGTMIAGATKNGLCLLEFQIEERLEKQIIKLAKSLNSFPEVGMSSSLELTAHQLTEYFKGKRKKFDIPLVIQASIFQDKVWKELTKIPYGKTMTYKELSERVSSSKAVRAVARANGENMISILIPCHRIIGSNGKLIGYSGGIEKKRYLLNMERESSPGMLNFDYKPLQT